MNKNLIVVFLFALIFHSCIDEDTFLMGVDEDIFIYNETKHQIHIKTDYDLTGCNETEYILLDSFKIDSTYKQKDVYFKNLYSSDNPKNTCSTTQFADSIAQYKIFYIEQGDSVFISKKLYDGTTFWDRKVTTRSRAMLFSAKYITHSLTITEEMFDKTK